MAQARVKLDAKKIAEIQRRIDAGESNRDIAQALGVSIPTVLKYNKTKLDKIAAVAEGVAAAAVLLDTLPERNHTTVFVKARQILSTQDANKTAMSALANIRAVIASAASNAVMSMSDSELVNPESLSPIMASLRTANEAGAGHDSIAQLEIKQGLNRSDLDSMSEEELRAELRQLGR